MPTEPLSEESPVPIPAQNAPWRAAALLTGGLLFAILGQAQYTVAQDPLRALLWYGIGVIQWIAALLLPETRAALANRNAPPSSQEFPGTVGMLRNLFATRKRVLLALAGTILGVITYAAAWDEHVDALLLLAWIGGTVCWWIALSEPGRRPWRECLPRQLVIPLNLHTLALAVILLAGAMALFGGLATSPGEMISDHAEYLMDVVHLIDGDWRVYFANNSGREPFFFYLVALATLPFGVSYLALKIVSASAALLTLPVLYVLGRQVEGRLGGLAAAGLGAFSVWTLIMGRIGFRVMLAGLASALLLAALWRALRSGRRADFLLAGLALGLGQFSYMAFRLAPLMVLMGVGLRWLDCRRPSERRRLLFNLIALLALALMIFTPLLSFWVHFPHLYWYRAERQVGAVEGDAIPNLLEGLAKSLLMFNFTSDPVPLNVVPRLSHNPAFPSAAMPILGPVTGALLLLGLIAGLWRACLSRRALDLYLPLALLVFVLPSALALAAPLETPSARRAIAALPPAMVLAGSALALPVRLMDAKGSGRALATLLLGGVLALNAVVDLDAYLNLYLPYYHRDKPPHHVLADQFRAFQVQGGRLENIYIVYGTAGGWVDPRLVAVWMGEPRWDQVLLQIDPAACPARPPDGGTLLFALGLGDPDNLRNLAVCFPEHHVASYILPNQTGFMLFTAPPAR